MRTRGRTVMDRRAAAPCAFAAACLLAGATASGASGAAWESVREGLAKFEEGDLEGAREQYAAAQVDKPDAPEIDLNLGIVHYRKAEAARAASNQEASGENFDTAADYFQRTLDKVGRRMPSGRVDAWTAEARAFASRASYNLGNVRVQQGKLEEAIETYGEALRYDPDNEDARQNLILVQSVLKARKEAEEQRRKEDDKWRKRLEEIVKRLTELMNEEGGILGRNWSADPRSVGPTYTDKELQALLQRVRQQAKAASGAAGPAAAPPLTQEDIRPALDLLRKLAQRASQGRSLPLDQNELNELLGSLMHLATVSGGSGLSAQQYQQLVRQVSKLAASSADVGGDPKALQPLVQKLVDRSQSAPKSAGAPPAKGPGFLDSLKGLLGAGGGSQAAPGAPDRPLLSDAEETWITRTLLRKVTTKSDPVAASELATEQRGAQEDAVKLVADMKAFAKEVPPIQASQAPQGAQAQPGAPGGSPGQGRQPQPPAPQAMPHPYGQAARKAAAHTARAGDAMNRAAILLTKGSPTPGPRGAFRNAEPHEMTSYVELARALRVLVNPPPPQPQRQQAKQQQSDQNQDDKNQQPSEGEQQQDPSEQQQAQARKGEKKDADKMDKDQAARLLEAQRQEEKEQRKRQKDKKRKNVPVGRNW